MNRNNRVNDNVNQPVNESDSELEREVHRIARELRIEPTDPMMVLVREMKRENTKLGGQVDQWTQTNLQLLKLLTAQSEENQRLAQGYSRLTTTLNGLEQQLQQLQQQTESLPKTLIPSNLATLNGDMTRNFRGLEQMLNDASNKISKLIAVANQPPRVDPAMEEYRVLTWSTKAILTFAFMLLGLGVWIRLASLDQLVSSQGYVAQRAAWSMTKLERIEKALGIRD